MIIDDIFLFGIAIFGAFFSMIFYVLFGQVTVRKLRKNKETKDSLGGEFASGLDVLNVAGALTRPKWLDKRIMASPTAHFAADAKVLYKHTNLFDRISARIFCIVFYSTGTFSLALALANFFGLFD
ncbi:hypothetical protein [Psychromonas aquimarina]|uniref:hypothetical protein n=1 Tax=Psychromonas aquimarina TaxID=444919 RepID=UPI000411B095|nr:hypothetical protein [Psychromonas aquimarina]